MSWSWLGRCLMHSRQVALVLTNTGARRAGEVEPEATNMRYPFSADEATPGDMTVAPPQAVVTG
jgi:hypothetical protein